MGTCVCESLGYGQSKERQLNEVQVAVVVILLNNWTSFRTDIILFFFFRFAIYPTDKMLKKTLDLAALSTRN